jgi:hypothetical protein
MHPVPQFRNLGESFQVHCKGAPRPILPRRLQLLEGRERITFQVPNQTFTRRKADGAIVTVSRKAYTRRSTRPDAWRTPAQPPHC